MHIFYPPNYLKHYVALLRLNFFSTENALSAPMPPFFGASDFQAFMTT